MAGIKETATKLIGAIERGLYDGHMRLICSDAEAREYLRVLKQTVARTLELEETEGAYFPEGFDEWDKNNEKWKEAGFG